MVGEDGCYKQFICGDKSGVDLAADVIRTENIPQNYTIASQKS